MEKVTDSIINVGVNDYDIELFEGQYELEEGMAYNSYVIMDDKIAILDTVDSDVTDEWMKNLKKALKKSEPDYLIVIRLLPDGSFEEYYNGKGSAAWNAAGAMQKNGQRSISLSKLRRLSDEQNESVRIQRL